MEYTLDQKFKALCQITRAAHFEWRATFMKMFPDMDPKEVVLKYWEIVGHDTAKAYLKQIDKTKPLLSQIAQLIVDSSLAMGENARVIAGETEHEIYFEHLECPWFEWHQKHDALAEDQPGCDCWIATILKDINKALGTNIEFETLSSLPNGDGSCKRVLRGE
ncbi:MAG: hypothetical protein ACE5NG_15415 [bacterium]